MSQGNFLGMYVVMVMLFLVNLVTLEKRGERKATIQFGGL
jgi:hypothetical protein